MVAKWRDGYEIVYGVRRSRESDSLPKRLTAGLYYRAHNIVSSRQDSRDMPATSGCSIARWSTSSAPCPSATAS